jgi:hypothetical protein
MASTKSDVMTACTRHNEVSPVSDLAGGLYYEGGLQDDRLVVQDEHVVVRPDKAGVRSGDGGVCPDERGIHRRSFALSCASGTNTCNSTELSEPDPSRSRYDLTGVYDKVASEATQQINLILKEAAKSCKDKDLMLCNIGGGQLMLLWGTRGLPNGFTPVNDIQEIRRILGVRPPTHAESWSGSEETTDGRDYQAERSANATP